MVAPGKAPVDMSRVRVAPLPVSAKQHPSVPTHRYLMSDGRLCGRCCQEPVPADGFRKRTIALVWRNR